MNKLCVRISCEFPVEASSSRRDRRDPCGVSVPTVTHSLSHCATELPGVSSVSVTLPSTERPRRQRSRKRNCTHRTCMPTGCKFAELLARFSGIAIHFKKVQFALAPAYILIFSDRNHNKNYGTGSKSIIVQAAGLIFL